MKGVWYEFLDGKRVWYDFSVDLWNAFGTIFQLTYEARLGFHGSFRFGYYGSRCRFGF